LIFLIAADRFARRGLHRQVVVIGHDAVVPADNAELFDDVAQLIHELPVVAVIKEDGHPRVSAGHDMPNQIRNLNSLCSGHDRRLLTTLAIVSTCQSKGLSG
jgi:hypothetical protein